MSNGDVLNGLYAFYTYLLTKQKFLQNSGQGDIISIFQNAQWFKNARCHQAVLYEWVESIDT